MTQDSDYIFFTDSGFDFDSVLIDQGYQIIQDLETDVVFQKEIKPVGPVNHNSIQAIEQAFFLKVVRPKRLWKKGKYAVCSPYAVMFTYVIKPNLMIRRIGWDTFPGNNSDVFSGVLRQCQNEAQAILTMLLREDVKGLEALNKGIVNQKDS